MLKRFTKSGKKQNKSGVILITILFILAVAFILIGSALMMTANTRKRVYTYAEGGQARLTATSAARVLDQALYEQELRDSKFKELCEGDKVIYFQDPSVPGMGGTESSSPDNYTKAVFDKVGDQYIVKVTTVIGSETENVLLTYEGTPATEVGSPFAFQVELGEGGSLERAEVGAKPNDHSARANYSDNIVVSRGNGTTPVDSTDFYSTFITTKPFYSASGMHFYGDLVYAGPDAAVDVSRDTSATGGGAMFNLASPSGYIYFINCNSATYGSYSAHQSFTGGAGTRVIFSNVGASDLGGDFFTGFGQNTVFRDNSAGVTSTQDVFSAAGADPGDSPVSGNSLSYYTGNLDFYMDPEFEDPTTHQTRPSSFQEYAHSIGIDESGNLPSGTTAMSLSSNATYSDGPYRVTGQLGGNDASEAPIITINVNSHDVFIYVTGNLTIKNGYFNITGGTGSNTGHKAYFIITKGASITLDHGNGSNPCGFVSNNCHSGSITGDYSETSAPACYIIGAGIGTNTSLVTSETNLRGQITSLGNGPNYIEAMVALYPNTDGSNDAGDLFTLNANALKFYGRIIANRIRAEQGGRMIIPYCPQFTTAEDPNKLYPVHTAYQLVGFDYYYEDAAAHTSSGLHTP